VEALRGGGARVLDVREPAEFAGAHLSGSINIGLGGKYATWCGTLLKPEEDIVIIAEPGREIEAATRLGRIGYDRVVGYLEGGMQPLESRAELVGRIERIAPANLSEQLEAGEALTVVDVRAQPEWEAGQVEGSVNIPLGLLEERADELGDDPVVVLCQSGYRSSIAASLLAARGLRVSDLVGGIAGWQAARLPALTSES
jgi:rhodanese-related sulfurtransferase